MSKWGYRKDEAQIFDLEEGEKLPDGWSDMCPPEFHPNVPKASAPMPNVEAQNITKEEAAAIKALEAENAPFYVIPDDPWVLASAAVAAANTSEPSICQPDRSAARPRMSRKRK